MAISAIGVGRDIKVDNLHLIAGEAGNVLSVADLDKLVENITQIKEASCGK